MQNYEDLAVAISPRQSDASHRDGPETAGPFEKSAPTAKRTIVAGASAEAPPVPVLLGYYDSRAPADCRPDARPRRYVSLACPVGPLRSTRGLDPALRALTVRLPDPAPKVSLRTEGELTGLPAGVNVAACRIGVEALTNVVKTRPGSAWPGVACRRHEAPRGNHDRRRQARRVRAPDGPQLSVCFSSMQSHARELDGTCDIYATARGTRAVLPVRPHTSCHHVVEHRVGQHRR